MRKIFQRNESKILRNSEKLYIQEREWKRYMKINFTADNRNEANRFKIFKKYTKTMRIHNEI